MQHNNAFPCQGAVKNARYAIAAFDPKLKKPITKGAGVRLSEIAAIHLHSFNKVLISGPQTQWKLSHFNPDFLVVVLNSVVHDSKHNKIVMLSQALDNMISGSYTDSAPHKTGAGIGVLELLSATNDALASFLLSQLGYIQIMVGWVGAPKGAPVSDNAGYANPAQFTTSEIGVSGGGVTSKLSEAAIMATVPTLVQPEISVINGQAVTSSLAVREQTTEQLTALTTRNVIAWVTDTVLGRLRYNRDRELSIAELCWWAVSAGIADAITEYMATRALQLPSEPFQSVYKESDIVPSVPATSILHKKLNTGDAPIVKRQDKSHEDPEPQHRNILKLKVDPESLESFMLRPKRRRWVNEKYTRWVKTQPCACCGCQADDPHHLIGHGQGGMGTKAHDLFVLPLCRKHHDELHRDPVAFEEKYGSQLELIFRFIDRALAIGVLS